MREVLLDAAGRRRSPATMLHHAYDQGHVDFRDLSAFAPVDDDEHVGEGVESARAPHPECALTAAADYGATPDRWVNFGVLADEYGDYRGWS